MQSQVYWAKGYSERLDCPVDANPPVRLTLWTKGQNLLYGVGRFDILLNGSLLASGVLASDQGSYYCTPISSLGQGQPSNTVQVIVRGMPCTVYYQCMMPSLSKVASRNLCTVLFCSSGMFLLEMV